MNEDNAMNKMDEAVEVLSKLSHEDLKILCASMIVGYTCMDIVKAFISDVENKRLGEYKGKI